MIRYLISEAKIVVPWGILLVPLLIAILRVTKAVSPEVPEMWMWWISFVEFIFPILVPLLAFGLLEQEKRWRTLEVMVATPKRKAAVFLVRYSLLLFPLLLTVAAAVRPGEYLRVIAPGLALGGAALLGGLILGEETGLGLALGWWGLSFAIAVAQPELLGSGPLSWIALILTGAPLSPSAFHLRKWVQFGAGLVFLLLALVAAERKRSWRPR